MNATIRRAKMVVITKRDGGFKCHYCGRKLVPGITPDGTPYPDNMATLDHIVPKSCGGTWANDNLVLACWLCNRQRGLTDYETFKASKRRDGGVHL